MKLYRKLIIVSVACITLGVAGVAPMAYFSMRNKATVAQAATIAKLPAVAPKPAPQPSLVTGKPVHLTIPSLNMNLDVADGVYNQANGTWTLSSDKAHYALPTTQPNNEAGNTLIYGHYRPQVFARLHTITSGAQVFIDTDNGYRFVYTFQKAETIDPSDTSIFSYEGKPRLTIQTCTGIWMQNRQFFYFDLTSFNKL